ncbi:uncharacterized protein PV07_06280 [Cladophialophora immunda]|uniref:Zn(2)-C6 fungal-type domain-containing protein n=1 Tax=Cladophialophora immunda TaxID=569365 RepID=A0A0D2AZ49_9EURO|nr:uncharacterized protein PV07_06280 [Cladophialophora immunda]KIW30542.1 hypothetical protein PV07_06280 [Cladophialophora immunda]OQU97198.1 Fungal Zn2-Cys6 binuclear cluster domain-containing protein [Cladophialophora immunda]
MGGAGQPHKPSIRGGARRVQVKTGCRTCKVRKIKCDENRPACRRCVSTGRVCDGYGVLGSEVNFYIHPLRAPGSIGSVGYLQRPRVYPFTGTTEEWQYLEWFKYRTSKKIPGASILALWDPLLYSACWSEPAVLHAVLSLSSVHRREVYESDYGRRVCDTPDKQERFTLQHYTRAIRHLQPPFAIRDKASARTALMTCFVFVCLELLCGHLATGQAHLENGLRLLRELAVPVTEGNGILLFELVPGSIDDAIVRAFCRLDLQSKLFRHCYRHPCQVLQISEDSSSSSSSPAIFRSVNQAWTQIEKIFGRVFHLTELARRQQQVSRHATVEQPSSLESSLTQIQAEISRCFDTLEASRNSMQDQDSRGLAYGLLFTYHHMAAIMADTCLRADDESVFDVHTQRFVSILDRAIVMWKAGRAEHTVAGPLPWPRIHMSRSIVDIGWIAPLYYTSLKCRAHRVRLQAIRLMETTSYREGMWDSKMASSVARRVMEIEEGDFYRDLGPVDDFALSSSPGIQALSLPTSPPRNRICELRMALSDGPADPILLHYRQAQTAWRDTLIFTGGGNERRDLQQSQSTASLREYLNGTENSQA